MTKRINPQPNYKKAIEKIVQLERLKPTDFKEACMQIVSKVAFDEILDITIKER